MVTMNLPTDQKKVLQDQVNLIESQESSLVLSELTNDTAFELGSLIRSAFLSEFDPAKDGIVISIALFSGHTLFSCAVGNPLKLGPDNWDWVARKSNTVKRFGWSSFLVGRTRLLKGKDLDGLGPEYAAHGGGFPLRIKGLTAGPVGVIVVSGLKQEDDHHLIVTALEKLLRKKT
ncbi:hypothetical protein EX895_001009 [Sporisorium graminicola]|uniref:Uncharacterized protein n=1 Tax=Sporisorium graminicola TaxID=280036 RepID=A0A4U7L2I2_9BASI|nr:hypothetical protein EX895_001009 [Sporisorium graminicola]TKY91010.1 hypothetical protein EX895_001009 [Sporisorium graminicola]